MVPPKSYADIIRGARARESPPARQASPASTTTTAATAAVTAPRLDPLPVLSPSTSSSFVLPVGPRPQAQKSQQTDTTATATNRSYAAALKGTQSPPKSSLPPSSSPPPAAIRSPVKLSPQSTPTPKRQLNLQADMEVIPVQSPSPSPSAEPECSLETPSEPSSEPSSEPELEPAGEMLWKTGHGHDVVIVCGEAKWFVHRYVLVRMSEFMEKYLPPEGEDGRPVLWKLNPQKWHAPMLSNVLRYMYIEEYDNCDYDEENPLDTESINLNVNHFIAAASVHCRPMMDHALSRLEEAREAIREVADRLRHARLDTFQQGLLRAHLSMWDQPDQWRLLSLRIVVGKLMAVALPVVLQSPGWAPTYRPSWGLMHLHAVADHMWLHAAGFCPHEPAITGGFAHLQIMWVRYRPSGWTLEDDFMVNPKKQTSAPPPPSPPSTPHRNAKKKKTKAVPVLRPDGTIDTSQAAPRGAPRGRVKEGRSTGLVQPVAKASSGKGKGTEKEKEKDLEEAVVGTTDKTEAEATSTAEEKTSDAGPSPILAASRFTGSYPVAIRNPTAAASTTMLDRPMPVGFVLPTIVPGFAAGALSPAAAVPAWAWHPVVQKYGSPPPPPPAQPPCGFPPPSPSFSGSRPRLSNRAPSSGQLSATAEPFLPGGRGDAAAEASQGGSSSPGLGSPSRRRMAELYIADEEGEST